jgi:hypothetical protein
MKVSRTVFSSPSKRPILVEAAAATSPLETMIPHEAYAQASLRIFVQMK